MGNLGLGCARPPRPRMHLAAALCYWLAQAESWFGAFLPEPAQQALATAQPAEDEARYLTAAQAGDLRVWASYWQRASGTTGLRQQLAYVARYSFPRGPTCSTATAHVRTGWRRCTMAGGSSALAWWHFSDQVEPTIGVGVDRLKLWDCLRTGATRLATIELWGVARLVVAGIVSTRALLPGVVLTAAFRPVRWQDLWNAMHGKL